MKHRLGGLENVHMGLGADDIPFKLDNSWSTNKELNAVADKMFNEALATIFKEIGGFDFKVVGDKNKFNIMFGYEPAYKHDPYLMCYVTSDYKDGYIEKGTADEYYGKHVNIESHKTLIENDCDKDFVDLVDKWYPELCKTLTIKML